MMRDYSRIILCGLYETRFGQTVPIFTNVFREKGRFYKPKKNQIVKEN